MIITIEEYDALTPEQKRELRYSNPCTVNGRPDLVIVGEVFDDELGHWKAARAEDF